jgi:long-subunit fatty acid transport protein
MQHQLTAKHTARFGYTFNQSPHDSGDVMESIFAPFYWQHTLHMGGSVSVSDAFSIDVGYSLVLPAELEGPILTPAGPVPNSSVEHRMHAHLLSLGATVKF